MSKQNQGIFFKSLIKIAYPFQGVLTFIFIKPITQIWVALHHLFNFIPDLASLIKSKNKELLSSLKEDSLNNLKPSINLSLLQQATQSNIHNILNSYVYASWVILMMLLYLLFIECVVTGILWHILILLTLFSVGITYLSCCHRIFMIRNKTITSFQEFIKTLLNHPTRLLSFPAHYKNIPMK